MENISAFKRFKLFVSRVLDKVAPGLLYGRRFYSQAGEDMLLSLYYEGKKHKGFYVDVGAHHPYRFSNTAYFYKRGWRGINIEPTPSLFKAFPRRRRRDINLNVGIGNGEKLTFYVFNEGALNTFDPEIARSRDGSYDGKYRIIRPMVYIKESSIAAETQNSGIQPLDTGCSFSHVSERHFIREKLKEIYAHNPKMRNNIFKALYTPKIDFLLKNPSVDVLD